MRVRAQNGQKRPNPKVCTPRVNRGGRRTERGGAHDYRAHVRKAVIEARLGHTVPSIYSQKSRGTLTSFFWRMRARTGSRPPRGPHARAWRPRRPARPWRRAPRAWPWPPRPPPWPPPPATWRPCSPPWPRRGRPRRHAFYQRRLRAPPCAPPWRRARRPCPLPSWPSPR